MPIKKVLGLVFAVCALTFFTNSTSVCEVCNYTGSVRSRTEFPFGFGLGYRYQISALEEFVLKHFPEELEHDWELRNSSEMRFLIWGALGQGTSKWGDDESLLVELYMNQVPKADVKALYDELRTEDHTIVMRQLEEAMNLGAK